MKKMICLLVVVCLLIPIAIPAAATDNNTVEHISTETISKETANKLSDIPIFITSINSAEHLTDAEKDAVSSEITKGYVSTKAGVNISSASKYDIVRLTDTQKKDAFNSPLYTATFNRAAELINSGTTVNYINIYTSVAPIAGDSASIKSVGNDPDDISYWESNCLYLGTYSGYKFLYLESSFNVETNQVTPGNITSSINWGEIIQGAVLMYMDYRITNGTYTALRVVQGALSKVFSTFETPLNITYGASSGYLKTQASGDLYMRTVFIRDDLDRIPGYAYYEWGATERIVLALRVDAKYPYMQNPSGTYEYRYPSYTFAPQIKYTPGYYGNSAFFASVVDLYENTIGYTTYFERFDIISAVTSLLG